MRPPLGTRSTSIFSAGRWLALTAALGLWAASAVAAWAAPPPSCPTGQACVQVDTATRLGPENHPGQGLLNGVTSATNPAVVGALHPKYWRVSTTAAEQAARHAGASPIEILGDLWYEHTATATTGGARPPWLDWAGYSTWVSTTVRAARAGGAAPDFWEVQNEPGGAGYYPNGVHPSVDAMLTQLAVAYRAIKDEDPTARVLGPSLALFEDHASPEHQDLDLATFLDFADRNHLRFDALSWHELLTHPLAGHDAGWWVTSPAVIIDHAARVRALLARHPSLGHPLLMVGEYAPYAQHLVPGWTVGYLSALDSAGIDGAGRSCWSSRDLLAQPYSECQQGLDGLLGSDQLAPLPVYWVHLAYAEMTGARVAATSSTAAVSALATVDPSSGLTTVLVGRHVSCTAAVNPACDEPVSAAAAPADVRVTVAVATPSSSSAVVAIVRIPNGTSALADPAIGVTPVTAPVVNGRVHLDLGLVGDGDAVVVTLR